MGQGVLLEFGKGKRMMVDGDVVVGRSHRFEIYDTAVSR